MAVKPENPAPGEDVFTEEDLLPDSEDLARRAGRLRRHRLDQAGAIIAVLAFGIVAGGMLALGAAAAPVVFKLPHPLSGNTMGAAFSRFDSVAIGCALAGLGAEVLRTVVNLRSSSNRHWMPRVRRYLAIFFAGATLFVGLYASPAIMAAYQSGVRRGVGAEGAALEATHKQAEMAGKIEVALAAALIALHVLTLGGGRQFLGAIVGDEEDDEDVRAPLPPGPSSR